MANNKTSSLEVVSGNRLTDGFVVYLAASGDWAEKIEDAAVAANEAERAALEDLANAGIASQHVVGWEFAEITDAGGARKAIKNIQFIRSLGPTVRLDLGKQADLYQ